MLVTKPTGHKVNTPIESNMLLTSESIPARPPIKSRIPTVSTIKKATNMGSPDNRVRNNMLPIINKRNCHSIRRTSQII
jgi:hypothetical protein